MPTLSVTNHRNIQLPSPRVSATLPISDPVDDILKPYLAQAVTAATVSTPPTITVTDDQGQTTTEDLTEDNFTQVMAHTMGDTLDPNHEAIAHQVLTDLLQFYDASGNLTVDQLFINQALVASGLPQPQVTIVYSTATDIIPAAQNLYASSTASTQQAFLASVGATVKPSVHGFGFLDAQTFEDFKTFVRSTVAGASNLTSETKTLLTRFDQLTLAGLTESLKLRNASSPQVAPNCFARLIIALLDAFAAQHPDRAFALPFSLSEALWPENLVFVNIQAHAQAQPRQIDAEWALINQATSLPYSMVNPRALNKLTQVARSHSGGGSATSAQAKGQMRAITRYQKARTKPAPVARLYQLVRYLLKLMGITNRSMNAYTIKRVTFNKPSRRRPDDPNVPGQIRRTNYLPDIHIWLDNSGSISEHHYAATIQMLIRLAKKFNINLYFNSFSHVLSPTTVLQVKNKSLKQIYKEFQLVTKVTGGTDYEQIYSFIAAHPSTANRLHLVLTDFEFTASRHGAPHPKNLYYLPMAGMNHSYMVSCAQHFSRSIEHRDPGIRQRLLGIYR